MLKVDFGSWGQNLESGIRLLIDSCLKSTFLDFMSGKSDFDSTPLKIKSKFIASFYELSYLILIDSGLNDFFSANQAQVPWAYAGVCEWGCPWMDYEPGGRDIGHTSCLRSCNAQVTVHDLKYKI